MPDPIRTRELHRPAAPRPSGGRSSPAEASSTSRNLLPARPTPPEPLPEDRAIRRWRPQQVRLELRTGRYDEEAALDAALEGLARDLGLALSADDTERAH